MTTVQYLMAEYGASEEYIRTCLKQTARKHKMSMKAVGEIILSLRADRLALLPNELLVKVLEELDYPTLTLFCSVSTRIRSICQDEKFWKKKLEQDFPGVEQLEKTWKKTYQTVSTPGLTQEGIELLKGIDVGKKKDEVEDGDLIVGYGPLPIVYQQHVKYESSYGSYDNEFGEFPPGPITLQQARDILAKLYDGIKLENEYPGELFDVVEKIEPGTKHDQLYGADDPSQYLVFKHAYSKFVPASIEDEEEDW